MLESWVLDLNGLEPAPGLPRAAEGRCPAGRRRSLFNHSHGGGYDIGKKEFVEGRELPAARALREGAHRPRATWLSASTTGASASARHTSRARHLKAMLWQGRVLWGMMVYDSIRALDWLADPQPTWTARGVATLGMSMGSSMAQWLGALDERVKATVDICCLTEYHTLLAEKGLKGHGIYYYVPGLLKHFTASDVNALIAPRAHLGLAGTQDPLTPARGPRHHRPRAEAGLRRGGASRALEAPALRRRAPGDAGGAAGGPRLPAREPLARAVRRAAVGSRHGSPP